MRSTSAAMLVIPMLTTIAVADTPPPPSGSSWGIILNDYSGDGQVDAADFEIWHESLGDLNRDGSFDAADFALWHANFLSDAGLPVNGFNGGADYVREVELAWRGVALRAMFPSSSAYSAWVAPLAGGFATAGDYNADGVVDHADYTVWRFSLITATDNAPAFMFAAGDFDDSGTVDQEDLDIWRANFGAHDAHNTPYGIPTGDFNEDYVIDVKDYTVWRDNLGATALPGPSRAGNDWWWAIDLDASAPCFADQTGDATLNADDIDAFVARFLSGDLAADATDDELLNLDDVDAFVGGFLAGCP